jgi:ATP-dependent RNA helicase DOB1
VDVLTRCVVTKDGVAKKKIKVVPLKEPGEPLIVSIPIDQVGPIHYSAV